MMCNFVSTRKKETYTYLIVTASVIFILCLIYQNANIFYPMTYSDLDDIGVFYFIKTIKDYGWNIINPMVGGINGTTMYDYMYSDRWSFGLIWIISRFVDNVFLIGNIFYFSCYIITALVCVYAMRNLGYSRDVAVSVSVLYAFCPYLMQRYCHMWLVPYYFLPLIVMSCVWMIEGEVWQADVSWWRNKKVWKIVFFSFLCSQTGLYYAFFACVLYAITSVISMFGKSEQKGIKRLYPLTFCVPILIGILLNVLPNILYWLKYGYNTQNEMAQRTFVDSEIYSLRFIQLILPRAGHRIARLAEMTQEYNAAAPLVNENTIVSLGIIAAVGFLISLIWIFVREDDCQRWWTISRLNIALFLVGTMGGVGVLFSFLIKNPMRCYNRISVVIMFVSLMAIASCLTKLSKKMSKGLFRCVLMAVMVLGVFDQTINYEPWEYNVLDDEKEYFQMVQETCEKGTVVFQLPYVAWPSGGNYRMFKGYLFTDSLRWSYGSMQGREEAVWQQEVMAKTTEGMLDDIKEAGYGALYIDAVPYVEQYGEEALQNKVYEISQILGKNPIENKKGELFFWSLESQEE